MFLGVNSLSGFNGGVLNIKFRKNNQIVSMMNPRIGFSGVVFGNFIFVLYF